MDSMIEHPFITGSVVGILASLSLHDSWINVVLVVFIIVIFDIGIRKLKLLLLGIFLGGLPMWAVAIYGINTFSGEIDRVSLLKYSLTLLLVPAIAAATTIIGLFLLRILEIDPEKREIES